MHAFSRTSSDFVCPAMTELISNETLLDFDDVQALAGIWLGIQTQTHPRSPQPSETPWPSRWPYRYPLSHALCKTRRLHSPYPGPKECFVSYMAGMAITRNTHRSRRLGSSSGRH